ncbi:hypothetical protein BDA99DRAFT_543673 [Phascolomyces articulosus]|uniref:D-isomer specific 2-hydroxyacid dehydrogenase NAD-binding domain-containing protein n=1 Tax=Phascolomyces articulosus TaxID=60185 RepID=A0AAD5JWJ7_9FUNG|nr:hypothetical protein BDA99DRAFT_543673 [Phascolomyces articulosus]
MITKQNLIQLKLFTSGLRDIHVKFISNVVNGYDTLLYVDACDSRGIRVSHTPDVDNALSCYDLLKEQTHGLRWIGEQERLYLFVNVLLNKNTFHILNAPQLSMMKEGVIVVNTAHSRRINGPVLVDTMEDEKVKAVGLDIFEGEPNVIHPRLLSHPCTMLLPHTDA